MCFTNFISHSLVINSLVMFIYREHTSIINYSLNQEMFYILCFISIDVKFLDHVIVIIY